MINFLKKWLIYNAKFMFSSYAPAALTCIFALFAVTYFRDYAMPAIGIFALVSIILAAILTK